MQFNLTKLPIPWASGSGYSQGKYADVVAKTVRDHGPVSACMNAQWGWHDYVGGVRKFVFGRIDANDKQSR